ncbi:TRAP transporter substrate-binding protein [Phytohalomonas tamaricis]|uniref:TRAP transporter substrate-binding protein n=1 Tax=Phytohalomonas tamaricis TaxID=2081032 RepID=UPI000D0BCE87|nr:TRAP transporter substrate-binding protein [Phytohalomonas tamaricis]
MFKVTHSVKALGFTLLISAALCLTPASADENFNLKLAYAQNSQPVKDALARFGELVKEKTDGTVTVTYFPDSQLGGESELVELLQTGAIDMTKVSGGLMGSFSPLYDVFSMPYLFEDVDHFYAVMNDNKIMDDIYQSTREQGFVGVGWYDSGQRNFYTEDRPIEQPDDLKGMKIRVMQNQNAVDMIRLLGGAPVVMSQGEIYTALQQGILDGAENNEFALTTARHGEVVNFYSLDGHTRVPDIILINSNTLSRMSDSQRQALMAAVKESTQLEIAQWDAAVAEARRQIQENFDVKINDVDKSAFREAVQPMYEGLKNKPEQYQIYQEIENLRAANH